MTATTAYDDLKRRIRHDWAKTLTGILQQARARRAEAILAFDLDSTLFDNRPRQARIVREFGRARNLACLEGCSPEHFTSGWNMKAAMLNCGLSQAQADACFQEARQFWMERFFTSDYCVDDIPIQGAVAFTRAVLESGATLCYVTGRHEAMRPGTVQAMRKCDMVLPGSGPVHLLMKPTFELGDDDYKRLAHEELARMGTVIAAFDNEPTHANDYRRKFPDATVFHLATDHSGRPVELLEGIISVPHFDLGS
jgi:hypothetical protein